MGHNSAGRGRLRVAPRWVVTSVAGAIAALLLTLGVNGTLSSWTQAVIANSSNSVATANAEARAAQDRQQAATDDLARYLAICAGPPGIIVDALSEWPEDKGHPDLKRPSEIARHEGCSSDTVIRKGERHGFGRKYGDHWRISLRRYAAWKKSDAQAS